MKKILIFSLIAMTNFLSTSHAQVTSTPDAKYREFVATISVSSGEVKKVLLQVNTDLRVDSYGDPEIPSHGFYEYTVSGSVVEDSKVCNFEVFLTHDISEKNSDRSGSIKLCSGLSIGIPSVRVLLLDASMTINLRAPGLNKIIGTGTLTSNGLKTVPTPEEYED